MVCPRITAFKLILIKGILDMIIMLGSLEFLSPPDRDVHIQSFLRHTSSVARVSRLLSIADAYLPMPPDVAPPRDLDVRTFDLFTDIPLSKSLLVNDSLDASALVPLNIALHALSQQD